MTRIACLLAAALVLAGSPALGADDDADEHAGHHPPAAAAGEAAQPAKQHEVTSPSHLQKNMETMREVMGRIRETTDPAEKRRLLGVHMLAMQEQIKSIRAMSARGGGHDHSAGGGDGKQSGKTGEGGTGMGGMMGKGGMMKMHKQTEQRIDALEQLMEQVIEHEAVEQSLEDGDSDD
jgi:hypothetical protein